jgi:hypothetical protein
MDTLRRCIYGKNSSFGDTVCSIVDGIKFSDDEKENTLKRKIVYKRFVNEVDYYENIASKITVQYNFLRIMITICSMLLPTLQTIQGNKEISMYDTYIFWISIFVSLKIMICNGFIALFKIDQRYTLYNLTSEKLKKAGWNYLERTGKYTLTENNELADYSYNLILFFEEIEQIKEQTTMKEFGDDTNHFSVKKDSKEPLIKIDKYGKVIDKHEEKEIKDEEENKINKTIERFVEEEEEEEEDEDEEEEEEETKYYSPKAIKK